MACHTGFGVGQASIAARLHAKMAIPAIKAKLPDVMLVTEGDRLGDDDILMGDKRGETCSAYQGNSNDRHTDDARKDQTGDRVGSRSKELQRYSLMMRAPCHPCP